MQSEDPEPFRFAHETAKRLLGRPLALPVSLLNLSMPWISCILLHKRAFGDSWFRPGLDDHTRALISVTIASVLGAHDPLRGRLRIALNVDVTKEEIVELFIHLEGYACAARAFDGYQIAKEILRSRTAKPA
jgi:alkylhydroperoxidase/carboxymuconolactone decarboxylase family protein YurZ